MPQSMTGFARAQRVFEWGTLGCELRSVNHRYLDLHFRLPDQIRESEFPVRERLKKSFSRGKIDCSLQLKLGSDLDSAEQCDLDRVRGYLKAAEEIDSLMSESATLRPSSFSALDILQLPGVLEANESLPESYLADLLEVVNEAIATLKQERMREGTELAEMVAQRLVGINEQVDLVREIMPELRENQRKKLTDRLEELQIEVNDDRLEQELVHLAQKLDVDEELDRLQAHIDEVERTLQGDKPIGRRLDFLMQELNREANTLGSKSQALMTTNSAVEVKVLIEQMREQIQNIE